MNINQRLSAARDALDDSLLRNSGRLVGTELHDREEHTRLAVYHLIMAVEEMAKR